MASADRQVVSEAASKAGIPFWTLWGVFGAESTWGRGGSNWFGLTSVPRTGSFAGDAGASASTLARLYHEHGTWEGAIRAYSGSNYGVSYIRQLARQEGGGGGATADKGATPPSGASSGKPEGFGEHLAILTEKGVLNVAFVVSGGLLILFGTKLMLQPIKARQAS